MFHFLVNNTKENVDFFQLKSIDFPQTKHQRKSKGNCKKNRKFTKQRILVSILSHRCSSNSLAVPLTF